MTEPTEGIGFILGVCRCGCGQSIGIQSKHRKILQKYKHNHHNPKREKSRYWKGGKIIHCGYIEVKAYDHPNRNSTDYIKEHRLIMEKHLGRYLTDNEIVHHINNDPLDNRIENLQLMTQAEHMSIHNPKIDLSDRCCVICDSNTTSKTKEGWARWYRFNDGFICHPCYQLKRKMIQ